MLKKTITYTDFNGEKRTEILYFNMSSPDMTRFIAKYSDYTGIDVDDEEGSRKALEQYVERLRETKDMTKVFNFLEDLILSSYGVKSDDGKRFMKSAKIREEFSWTNAYAEFFEELMSDEDKFKHFIQGIVDNKNGTAAKSGVSVVQ